MQKKGVWTSGCVLPSSIKESWLFMFVIQVVGFKNSGKTTFVGNLIKMLRNNDKKVASLKHHGHGGLPVGFEKTDSEKHLQAGAIVSGVEGDGRLQLSIAESEWTMEQMLSFYKVMNIETLIIEGFKQHHFNKIILVRSEEDLILLDQLTNIKAIVTSLDLEEDEYPFPVFHDHHQACIWITTNILTISTNI
ncbi:molybdopterin-guanine dinucleotide biosynthesis protein B [Aquibacillus rhizosphaerae]|uniref:Molybdopterin-guanine dinucleotide biosynthesis protein B n=1 Tax=Aquibacillus rhizosphaerae TaxID=3051431 RepID=A0ABT7L7U0_9BACI|nr:molybdopterin-guanine dinucleotide biosynthesis protein B [Aquibacillus sp. LR5S19]MDL4841928.1 molybdopterin-guanine dinucleotide biosynthesis protein B [Aquibacillus sp. LR5S19]